MAALLQRGANALTAAEASIDRLLAALGIEVTLEPTWTEQERVEAKARIASAALEQIR